MPTFTEGTDWMSRNVPIWDNVLAPWMGQPNVRMCEVGCFEGRSTLWFLEHVLTHPTSTITVIDTFAGSAEHETLLPGYDWSDLYGRFCCNLLDIGLKYDEGDWGCNLHDKPCRVRILKGDSFGWLHWMINDDNELHDSESSSFDLIYLDGSHRAADVLTDAVLAWRLLKPGGLLIADDMDFEYITPSGEPLRPRVAMDAFVRCFGPQIGRVWSSGLQLFAWKAGE